MEAAWSDTRSGYPRWRRWATLLEVALPPRRQVRYKRARRAPVRGACAPSVALVLQESWPMDGMAVVGQLWLAWMATVGEFWLSRLGWLAGLAVGFGILGLLMPCNPGMYWWKN